MSGRNHVLPKGGFVSYLKDAEMNIKGCMYHLVRVTDTEAEVLTLEFVPVMNEFSEVFLYELPRSHQTRKLTLGSM